MKVKVSGLFQKISPFVRDDFFANHPLQWLYVAAFVFHAGLWVLCIIFFPPSDTPVIVYYNAFLGVDMNRVGSWQVPYVIPILMLFFLLVESVFAWYFFHKKDRLIAHLLLFSAVLLQISGVVALTAIVLVNK